MKFTDEVAVLINLLKTIFFKVISYKVFIFTKGSKIIINLLLRIRPINRCIEINSNWLSSSLYSSNIGLNAFKLRPELFSIGNTSKSLALFTISFKYVIHLTLVNEIDSFPNLEIIKFLKKLLLFLLPLFFLLIVIESDDGEIIESPGVS